MNFKKKSREVEDENEKIRDKRSRVNFTSEKDSRIKDHSNRYQNNSLNEDSENEANMSKSPVNNRKLKKEPDKSSQDIKRFEDSKKKNIKSIKVNMTGKETLKSPKQNSKNIKRYSPMEDSERENSPDYFTTNKKNKEYSSNHIDSAKKKNKKETLTHNYKSKEDRYNTRIKDNYLKDSGDNNEEEEEEFNENNYSGNIDHDNSNEENEGEEGEDEEIYEEDIKKKNTKYKKLKSMFKPEVDKYGKLLVQNVESFKPIEEKSSSPQTALQKMNRLSNILISKSQEPENRSKIGKGEISKGMFNQNKNGKGKFISITLAMLSSKGPNCEDRAFTRDVRVDKGGVVDLAQQQSKKPVKSYQIKKITNHRSPSGKPKVIRYNPKDREKAAKLVQFWWREILKRYKIVNEKITKIQAIFRGSLVRSYIFELLYFSLLAKNFVDKFEVPVKRHAKKSVINKLLKLFGDEVKDKFTIMKIIKLQRFVKEFLSNLRDKRMKFYLVCEKIKYRFLKPFYYKLKSISPENNKKFLKAMKFIGTQKEVITKNQFKRFIKELAIYPIKKLEERIKSKILKNHINNMIKLNLRHGLIQWIRLANNKHNPTAIKILVKRTVKSALGIGFNKIKKMPPKNLKERIIKKLVEKAKRYSDIIQKEYLMRLGKITLKLIEKEFKSKVLKQFMNVSAQTFKRKFLSMKFKKWQISSIKSLNTKHYGDCIYLIEYSITKHSFNAITPILKNCIEGLKSKSIRNLLMKLPIMKLNVLRIYLTKFRKICARIRNIELSSNILKHIGSKHFEKLIIRLTNSKFQKWKNKVNILRYVDMEIQNGYDRRKIFASSQMGIALQNLCRQRSEKTAFPMLMNHLINSIKSVAIKSIIKLYPKLSKILMRNILKKWVFLENKMKINDFRNKVFLQISKNINASFHRLFVKKGFTTWYKNCPKNIAVKVLNGSDLITYCFQRKYMKALIKGFSRKIDKENLTDKLIKSVKLKDLVLHNKFKSKFFYWLKMMNVIKSKELKETFSAKVLYKYVQKKELAIISKRLFLWRQIITVKKALIRQYNKTKAFYIETRNMSNLILKNTKKEFIERMKRSKSNEYIRISLNKIVELAFHAHQLKMRKQFNTWRLKLKDMKLKLYRTKYWKSNIMNLDIKSKKSQLMNSLKTWAVNARLDHVFKTHDKNMDNLLGLSQLIDISKRKRFEAFLKIKELLRLDHRGKLMFIVRKKLVRKKYELGRCYEKWKRIKDHYIANNDIKILKNKILYNVCKNLASRFSGDCKLRCWNKWRSIAMNVNDKYFKKIDGVNTLQSFIIHKYCQLPLNIIDRYKNYKKLILYMLPKKTKLAVRFNTNLLKKKLDRWKKYTHSQINNILISKIILGLAVNKDNKLKTLIVSRRFKDWISKCFSKLNNRKIQLPNAVKAFQGINLTLEQKYLPEFYKKLTGYAKWKAKNKCMKKLFFISKTFCNSKLRNYLGKWWKISLLLSNTFKLKIEEKSKLNDLKTRFSINEIRKLFIMNWILKPTEKYFKRWIKTISSTDKSLGKGLDLLKGFLKKKVRSVSFPLVKNYKSPKVLQKALKNKIFPKCRRLLERYYTNMKMDKLKKWKSVTDLDKLKTVTAKIIKYIYTKNYDLRLKNCFRKWQDKKSLEFADVKLGEMILFKTFANKYLGKGFFKDLNNYSKFRFLRSSLLKTSKYHRRNLSQFIIRWNKINEKLKSKELQAKLFGKLLARMYHFRRNKEILELMKIKLKQWSFSKDRILIRRNEFLHKGSQVLKRINMKRNFPLLKEKFCKNKIRNLRNSILFNRMKKNGVVERLFLKEFSKRWLDKVRLISQKLFKSKIISLYLKNYQNRLIKISLKDRFSQWKEYDPTIKPDIVRGGKDLRTRGERERIFTLITIGKTVLQRFILKESFKTFYKIAHLFNRKIPEGTSLKKALLFADKGLAKVVSIRNLLIRPKFIFWNKYILSCQQEDLKEKVCFRIFNKKRMLGNISLRKCLNRWKEVILKMVLIDTEEDLRNKMIKLIYAKNQKIFLSKKMNHWKGQIRKIYANLEKVHMGLIKLMNNYTRNTFIILTNYINLNKQNEHKKERALKTFKKMLFNTEKGKKLYYFNMYKNICHKIKLMILKHQLLKYVLNRYEKSTKMLYLNKLHEKFLKLYFMTGPVSTLQKISVIIKAIDILKRGLNKRYLITPFNLIRKKAINKKILEGLLLWAGRWDDKAKLQYLKNKFIHWKLLLSIKNSAKKKLYNLFKEYEKTPVFRSDNISGFKKLKKLMEREGETRTILVSKIQNKFRSFQKKLKDRKFGELVKKISIRASMYHKLIFKKWKTIAHMDKYEYSAIILQKYFRLIAEMKAKYIDNVKILVPNIENYLKSKACKKIETYLKLKRKVKMFFKRWKYQKTLAKRINAANLLTGLVKGFFTRRLYKTMVLRKMRINQVVTKLFGKHLEKTKLYFNMWKLLSKFGGVESSAKIIQDYVKKRIKLRNYLKATKAFHLLFRKYFVKKIKIAFVKTKLLNKDRGTIMFRILEKNLKESFKRTKEFARKRGQIICLRQFYPKFIEGLRLYWTLFYIRRWKKNVIEYRYNKVVLLQNKVKGKLKLWKLKSELKKYQLLEKIALKLSKDTVFLKRSFLKIWYKKANYLSMNKAAKTVQSIWTGVTSRKNADREVNKLKIKNCFRRLFLLKMADEFSKMSDFREQTVINLAQMNTVMEVRYATNNILSLSNCIARNLILFKITKNKTYLDAFTYKNQYFQRWKQLSNKYDDCALIVQSKYRQYKAKKLLELLLKIKERLINLMKKHIENDNQRNYITLMSWKIKIENFIMNESASTLQKYIRQKMINKRLTIIQNFFKKGENQLVCRRLNTFIRLIQFKRLMVHDNYFNFFKSFKLINIKLIIKQILLKKFYSLEEAFKILYKKEKLLIWSKKTNLINQKRYQSAILIQSCFRRFEMRKMLCLMMDVKKKNLKLLLKLTNRMEIKRDLYFQLWKKYAIENKYELSSRILQNYMNYIREKVKKKNNYIKFKRNYDGLKIIKDLHDDITKNCVTKLKLYSKFKRSIEILSFLKKLQSKLVLLALNKINEKAKLNKNDFNNKVNIIQEMYRMYKKRMGIMKYVNKLSKLRYILSLILNKDKRKVNKSFNYWKRNTLGDLLNFSARNIQKFIEYRIKKKMNYNRKYAMKAIKLMIIHKREKDLKTVLNLGKIKSFQISILKAIFKRLKNKVNYIEKLSYLNKLFRFPPAVCRKFLKRSMMRFKDICERIATEEYFNNQGEKRKQLIAEILQKKLLNLHQKYNDKKQFFCRLWSGKIKDRNVKDAARTINKYVERKYKDLKVKRKWLKLFLGKCIRNHKYHMLHINTRIKHYLRLTRIFKLFAFKINLQGFKHLVLKCHLHRVHHKLTIVLGNTHDRNINMIKYHFWRRWRHVNSNLRLKDYNLIKLAKIYNERRGIIGFKALNEAFSIKKMIVLFQVLKRRKAFEKLKMKSLSNSNFYKLGKALTICRDNCLDENKNIYLNRLYSIYVFRRLSSYCNEAENIVKRFKHVYFKQIKEYSYLKYGHSYYSKINFKRETTNSINLSFSTKKVGTDSNQNVKADQISKDKMVQIQYVMPYFIKYTQDVLNKRCEFPLERMKYILKLSLFARLNNLVEKKEIELSKQMFFYSINRFVNNNTFNKLLRQLFRKYFLMKLSEDCLKPTAKFMKLIYFIRVAKMHSKFSDKKYMLEITKYWRFMAHMKRLSFEKLNSLFKNIEGSYMNMGEEIFGKNKDEFVPSLIHNIDSSSSKKSSKINDTPKHKEKYKFNNLINNEPIEVEELNSKGKIKNSDLNEEKVKNNQNDKNRSNEISPSKKSKTTKFNNN